MEQTPRRYNIMEMSQAEIQLLVSALEMEKLGDDSRLQQAQTLVAKARELVADYVDELRERYRAYEEAVKDKSEMWVMTW